MSFVEAIGQLVIFVVEEVGRTGILLAKLVEGSPIIPAR